MPTSHLIQFIGGLAFFFFGLSTIQYSLKGYAGERFKSILAKSTRSRLRSLLTGITITFFMQSSSAVSVMSMGLASSGLVTLEQAMALSLGAGIGTTIVVFFISFKEIISQGLIILVLGMGMHFMARRKVTKIVGDILLGFGFIFFGIAVMSEATVTLKSYSWIPQIFNFLASQPFLSMSIALIITAFVHSSAIILGILISLAHAGSISLNEALPLILGANLGTSFTAIMMAFKAKTEGKRAAWANLLLKVGAALMIWPMTGYLAPWLQNLFAVYQIQDGGIQISFVHLGFNFFVALVFLPLLSVGKIIICKLIPHDESEEKEFAPKYLDKNALETPALAFAQVRREIVRMGEILQVMLAKSFLLFEKYDLEKVEEIQAADHHVDTLYKAIKFYIAHLPFKDLKDEDTGTSVYMMSMANELEEIGDLIDHNILRLARRKWNNAVEFSDEGWKELGLLHEKSCQTLSMMLSAVFSGEKEILFRIKNHHDSYVDLEEQGKMAHLKRLHQGLKESIETSSIHMELVSIFHRINASLVSIIKPYTGESWKKQE